MCPTHTKLMYGSQLGSHAAEFMQLQKKTHLVPQVTQAIVSALQIICTASEHAKKPKVRMIKSLSS